MDIRQDIRNLPDVFPDVVFDRMGLWKWVIRMSAEISEY